MEDVECPYCEKWVEINHDDGYGYDEGTAYQQHCYGCDKNFVYYTTIHFSYDAQKADCLNGEPHKYKPTSTHPNFFTKMRCEFCEHERKPTQQERTHLGIPDKFEI
jgi:hypothetical protein